MTWKLSDFYNGTNYVDEDGCVISEDEAKDEVEYLNKFYKGLMDISKEEDE